MQILTKLPDEIKLTYIIAIVVMVFFVVFIIIVVFLYNKKQLFYIKEKQLQRSEHQNEILQKELERQKSIQAERERISHDMHDDLGAGISALKLQTEFLKEKLKEDQSLQKDLDELLKTSEDMNLSMREMLWSLNTKNDTLDSFADYIHNYADQFLKKTDIGFQSNYFDFQSSKPISSDTRRHLFLCIKEALNNLYKHSKATQVFLDFSENNNHLNIEITDNGIGLNGNHKEGNGFNNMRFRMKACCGTFEILPSDQGTHLKVSFPV